MLDETGGTKTVNGGVIYGGTGNTNGTRNGYGGGVYVAENGTFTMNGGSIVGCKAEGYSAFGGGVFVAKNGTFEMTGGKIVGCTAVADEYGYAYGGGVRNDGEWQGDIGRTTLSGTAEIRDCHAKGSIQPSGGGISDAGTLTISGDVKIIGCTADGMGADAMYVNANNGSSITGGSFYGSIEDLGNKINGLTVTYHLNNDKNYATQVLQPGDQITLPDPAKLGYAFDGWYKDGTKWDATAPVTENLTLTGWLYYPVKDETELTDALADNSVETIRLMDDITLPRLKMAIIIRDGRQLILDLNGHVLDLGENPLHVGGGTVGIVTIMDNNPDAPHKFTPDADGLWVWDKGAGTGTETVLGGVITGSESSSGSVIRVGDSGSKVIMNGGNIVGHKTGGSIGGAVCITGGGRFTMNGGAIIGCTAEDGGGVCVLVGTFELAGGIIKNCKAVRGGAVRVGNKDGIFTMTGGEIKNCMADLGCAIYLNGGKMNADGGTVDGTVMLDVKNNGDKGIIQGGGSNATHFSGDVTSYGEIGHGTFSGTVTLGSSTLIGTISGGIFNGPVTTDSEGEADISGGVFNNIVTINRGEITKGTFNKDVVVYNALGSFRCTTLTGGTYNGLIINKSAYAAFAGAHSPLGIVETKPSAQYSNDQYRTVTFDLAGGEMDYPVRYFSEDGNISSEIKPAPRTGYTFGGWYKADGTAWNYASDRVTGDITLYAKWTPHTFTVTFDSTGGSEMITKTMDVTYGEPLGDMPVPIRLGYFFCGWYDALAGGKCYGDSDGKSTSQYDKTENCTLYAQWKINQYTITFDTAGGSKIDSITQDYGTTITAPANPTRKGYTFMGWDKKIPETMPAENITVTARWKDSEKPTGEIKISENSWKSFLNNITFGLFFKDTQTVTITAADNSGETVKIEYLLSNKELTEAKLANAAFTVYTAPFGINPDNEYIIYVRLTDKTGNVSYICSDGIVLDGTSPVIKGIENGKIYCEAQTVTIDERYVDTVFVNRTEVTLDENSSFVLSPADGEQKIIVTDKAGNTAEMTVTVNDGHTFGEWASNGDGTHTRKCTVDGCNGSETKDCSGGKATCTEKAVCEVCGKAYGETDPKNHSNLVHSPANAATTAAEGNTEYWYCDGCGKYFADAAATKEITKADTVTERLPSGEKSPKTGNTGNLALWLAAAFIGGAVCSAFAVKRRKTASARR